MNAERVEDGTEGATKQTAADGKLTVYLTDRPPVRVVEADWPVTASADLPIYRVSQNMADRTLNEAITYTLADADYDRIPGLTPDVEIVLWLKVSIRKHADGRCLLYGIRKDLDGSSDMPADSLGGVLLHPTDDLRDAISINLRCFVNMCGGCSEFAFQKYVDWCFQLALPPEILDDVTSAKEDCGFLVLNGPRKVQISRNEWPIVSEAIVPVCCSPHSMDQDTPLKSSVVYGRERLVVRRHHDNRFLVYGYSRYEGDWAAQFDIFNARGGELISNATELWDAIRRVGAALGFSAKTIRTCLNSFSAEELY